MTPVSARDLQMPNMSINNHNTNVHLLNNIQMDKNNTNNIQWGRQEEKP